MALTRQEAIVRFRGLASKKREADAKVMELMRHPDTLPEQLIAVHHAAVSAEKAMDKAVTILRGRWRMEDDVSLISVWNEGIYDKHDKRFVIEEN